jgi:hypothetical protein
VQGLIQGEQVICAGTAGDKIEGRYGKKNSEEKNRDFNECLHLIHFLSHPPTVKTIKVIERLSGGAFFLKFCL